jgi:tetratricopeptide (TPR) repeat protein
LYQQLGNTDAALADFTYAIQLCPQDVYALFGHAEVWQAKGDLRRAANDYTAAIKWDARSDVFTQRGLVRWQMGNYNGALDDFNAAIRLERRDLSAYLAKAALHFVRQNYSASLSDLNSIIDMLPTSLGAYYVCQP